VIVAGQLGSAPDAPPTVALTNPTEGATVAGTVAVAATASDDRGVAQVEFFVDDVSVAVDTAAPYEATWSTTTYADGSHLVNAGATWSRVDERPLGQTAEDASAVTVRNTPVATKPHVGDLDGARTVSSRNWRAEVTITVLDDLGGPVAGQQRALQRGPGRQPLALAHGGRRPRNEGAAALQPRPDQGRVLEGNAEREVDLGRAAVRGDLAHPHPHVREDDLVARAERP
jgi:hypothetical protein